MIGADKPANPKNPKPAAAGKPKPASTTKSKLLTLFQITLKDKNGKTQVVEVRAKDRNTAIAIAQKKYPGSTVVQVVNE